MNHTIENFSTITSKIGEPGSGLSRRLFAGRRRELKIGLQRDQPISTERICGGTR